MNLKAIIQRLQSQGHILKFYKRKDGGYVITRIDGVIYKGKTGNKKARELLGVTLSEARAKQLKRIKTPKGKRVKKLGEIPEELEKRLKSIQRLWRKTHASIEGYISKSSIRWAYENLGEEEAKAMLDRATRYASGLASLESIEGYLERLKNAISKASEEEKPHLERVYEMIEERKLIITEITLEHLVQDLYEWEKNVLSAISYRARVTALVLGKTTRI